MNDLHSQNRSMCMEQLEAVRALYEQGLFLQAYRLAGELGPLHTWSGAAALVLAGRLAHQLGSPTLSHWLVRKAWRAAPDDPEACYYYASWRFRWRGPYAVWRWMGRHGDLGPETGGEIRSWWYALRAHAAGVLRDFDTAESWLARAVQCAPRCEWIEVCRAVVLETEDRYGEALAAAQRALEIHPWYVPAVECAGHLLTLLDRDQEALALFSEGAARLESAGVVAALYALQVELKQYAAARDSLDRWIALSPLAQKTHLKWLAAQRSEVAYHLGDYTGAIRFAKESDHEFFKAVAQRMADPAYDDARRVSLPVAFVRQHHQTCVPATLSAISRYWSRPADHLQVAEAICYNGTTSYSERRWAERNDWLAREFTVTEQTARALLDAGVPFTFTTVDPGAGHLQAVIGYDGRRGTLVVRDPFWRNSSEALTGKLLERYRAYGPRGMALVPAQDRARLEAVHLPDAALWDRLHAFDGALTRHCRDEARQILEGLRSEADGHRIAREARRRMAVYDANPAEQLDAVEQLLELAPDDPCLQLERLHCLRNLARRDQRLAIYQRLCSQESPHPVFLRQYGQELRADAARRAEAIWLLRRAIRLGPLEAGNYYVLANLLWDERQFEEAMELYRFAACLDDKEEEFAHSYFVAAQWFKRTEEALEFLRSRFERFGKKSGQPARTLFSAYMHLQRTREALEVIEQAMTLRHDDQELLVFAADAYVTFSAQHGPRAAALLDQARERSHRGEWLRTAARLAAIDGQSEEALRLWRQLLEFQPLALDAHRAVAVLLAEAEGRAAALAHLEHAASGFPHYQPLQELWVEWMNDEPAEIREPVLRRVIAANPENAWLHRELGFLLGNRRRIAEAWEEAERAARLDPQHPSLFHLRAHLLRTEGKTADAKAALRDAVLLSVDNDYAIRELMDLCDTLAERREILAFVKDQLVRQVIFGDALLTFRDLAHGTLAAEELLALLREALEVRPDLWHAWSACTVQLLNMERWDEAWQLACQATERFPLLPRLWLDRAAAARAREDAQSERQALETACQINPDWGTAVRGLCEFHERQGDLAESRRLLEQVTSRNPLDVACHVMLAETLWLLGERESALEHVRRGVEIQPGYMRAWDLLNQWAAELGQRDIALAAARRLTLSRGGEARSWLMLARCLDQPDQLDERLAALGKSIELNPQCADAYDLRARALARAGRWEEAKQACRPEVWSDRPPAELQARAAWVEAEQGNLQQAIAAMRDVVREDPAMYGAWTSLQDWCGRAGDAAGCLEAAEAMVRLAPQYEVSLGCLGEARMMNQDRAGAQVAFRRAFELNPAYEYAGNSLFDLQLEDGELGAAAQTIAALRKHSQSPYVLARAAQLAARQREFEPARAALAQLCVLSCESDWPVTAAIGAAVDAGWRRQVREVLENAVDREDVHPRVPAEWVKLCTASDLWSCGQRLRALYGRGEPGRQALFAYFDALARKQQKLRWRIFVWRNRAWLQSDSYRWGIVAYAAAVLRSYRFITRWVADWRRRPGVEAWMLVNAVEGLRATGRDKEAAEASRHALALPPSNGQDPHRVWLAFDEACAGNAAAARTLLEDANHEERNADDQFIEALIRAMLEMLEAAPQQRHAAFRSAKQRIAQARAGYATYAHEPGRRRVYRRCLRRIALSRGGLLAAVWRWLRWIQS